jgi:methionine sulfoxide reductase catalytic subunit
VFPVVHPRELGRSCIFGRVTTTGGDSARGRVDSSRTAVAPTETTHHVDYPAEVVDEEMELEQGYRTEVHSADDVVDVKTYGGGFDLTRRATAPRLRVGRRELPGNPASRPPDPRT